MLNYSGILKSYEPFYKCSSQIEPASDFGKTTAFVTAPVLYSYVWWVLSTAIKKKIKRLYFLSRDGYILFKIANIMCSTYKLNIDCRYLYCSRNALRMPTYHFIGDEAFNILLMRGFNLTAYNILMRLNLSEEERLSVYADIEFSGDEDATLPDPDYQKFIAKIKKSTVYFQLMTEKSLAAYDTAKGYLIQEGLTEKIKYGIVDSGWTGSMQRSLRQILSSFNKSYQEITGFYFGMYVKPRHPEEDGDYLTWYFSGNSPVKTKAKFNNNLFECMCAAPHGMVMGYELKDDKYVPIMRKSTKVEDINIKLAKTQISLCCKFAEIATQTLSFECFESGEQKEIYKVTKKLLQKLMYKPAKADVFAMGAFVFCDDISECYFNTLAKEHQKKEVKAYGFTSRIHRKIFRHSNDEASPELFWPYGSLALSDLSLKGIRRINMLMWDYARFTLNGGKHHG